MKDGRGLTAVTSTASDDNRAGVGRRRSPAGNRGVMGGEPPEAAPARCRRGDLVRPSLKQWGLRLAALAFLLAFYAAIAIGVWMFAQVDR